MSDPSLKYLIPKLNNIISQAPILTDNFCVAGCNTLISNNENPIYSDTPSLAYTYDGVNFTSSSNTILTNIYKIDFNGYQWIACGSNSTYNKSILVSSDGINWIEPINNVLAQYVLDVVWGQKKWVAVGIASNDQSYVATSSDGMHWDRRENISINCIAYNGSYFIGGGTNIIYKSTDGITWTNVNVANILGFVNSVTWSGKVWVATGTNASPIGYSYDGVTWTQVSTNGLINAGFVVVYNGTTFLAAGVGVWRLISSFDGINWTGVMLTSNYTYFPGSITDITWNGRYWIVTNATNNLTDPKIAYSSDLINWTSSISGNTLFNNVTSVNAITSRSRKNYINAYTY
jgi:hypothetical protein